PDEAEAARLRDGQLLVGFLDPLGDRAGIERLAELEVVAFAMESVPRITRAQAMDALSSQATVGGYKAALLAAEHLPRFFPMLMTAAGTVPPAQVLVIGAGGGAGPGGPGHNSRVSRAGDAARLGDRRPCCRHRRQLRAHATRRGGRARRSHPRRPHEPSGHDALPRVDALLPQRSRTSLAP